MTDEFVPTRPNPWVGWGNPDLEELEQIYKNAWEHGLWIKEWGASPNGKALAACGSLYELQRIEHENPEIGDIDIADLSLGDCVELSVPGSGDTRPEACRDAVKVFLDESNPVGKQLRDRHLKWAAEAV